MNKKRLILLFACCYIICVIVLSIYQHGNVLSRVEYIRMNREMGFWNYNLIPFKTIGTQLSAAYLWDLLIKNLAVTVPLGMAFAGMKEKIWKSFLWAGGIIVGKEILQFVTMTGYFDVDDIIVNLSGAALGVFLYKVFKRTAGSKK